jgi:hypothetical protein
MFESERGIDWSLLLLDFEQYNTAEGLLNAKEEMVMRQNAKGHL